MKLGSIVAISMTLAAPVFVPQGAAWAGEDASFADGVWVGKGIFQMGDKLHGCSEVRMKFVGNATSFQVHEASMACDELGTQTFPAINKFSVDGGGGITFVDGSSTALKPDTKVGAIKGNSLAMLNPIEAGKVDDIKLRREGDVLLYDQVFSAPGQTPDYSLVAIMTREKPATAAREPSK